MGVHCELTKEEVVEHELSVLLVIDVRAVVAVAMLVWEVNEDMRSRLLEGF